MLKIRSHRMFQVEGIKTLVVLFLILTISVGQAQIWGPDTRLTNDPDISRTSDFNRRCVAVSGDTVHVVWIDTRDAGNRIFYKQSLDNGSTWSDDTFITDNSAVTCDNPSIAVSGSNVHVVWKDDRHANGEVYYKRSTDNGSSWTTDIRLTDDIAESWQSAIAVWDINTHVVWSDGRTTNPWDLLYKRSTNNGSNWGVDRVFTDTVGDCTRPAIAAVGNSIHAVWMDERDVDEAIYYRRSLNNGDSWEDDLRLTDSSSSASIPSIAASADNIHVVWQDGRSDFRRVYYKRSLDNGITWGNDTPLSPDSINTDNNLEPCVSLSGEEIHVVWCDMIDGNWEIYYRRSRDNGETWEDVSRLTNNPSQSIDPSIEASEYNLHIVWTDERDGNTEIYYKHGFSGSLQPDNLIKNDFETFYIGDGIYNDDGTNQVEERTIRAGDTAVFHIRVENDGDIPEELTVLGTAQESGWTVTYYDSLTGGTDITILMTTLGWSTGEIEPDSFTQIRAEVVPDVTIPEDSAFGILVTSVSTYDTTRLDAVSAITIVGEPSDVVETAVTQSEPTLEVLLLNDGVSVNYGLACYGYTEVVIADVTGRIIRTLVSGNRSAGIHKTVWDARDERGNDVSAGIYFCTLKNDHRTLSKKFVLVE